MSQPLPFLTGLSPRRAVPGGRVRVDVSNLEVSHEAPPSARIGDARATVALASSTEVDVLVPLAAPGGRLPIRLEEAPGSTVYLEVGRTLATGLHMVDSPAVGLDGSVYGTYSGARGQQSTVSVYRIGDAGVRDVFVTGLTNATSMALDPKGRLHVSSRFDGTVSRIDAEGHAEVVASDLGVATGLAFDPDGVLYVGDRSGTVFRIPRAGGPVPFASLPPSVAAYHLAWSPEGHLYASVPTLATHDVVYRVDRQGGITVAADGFGRPQGLAVDASGTLYVVEALAGVSGVYRLLHGREPRELIIAGPALIGVAIHPAGGFVVSSQDTIFRFEE